MWLEGIDLREYATKRTTDDRLTETMTKKKETYVEIVVRSERGMIQSTQVVRSNLMAYATKQTTDDRLTENDDQEGSERGKI